MNPKTVSLTELFRYLKFLIGGGLSLLFGLGITYALTEVLGLWHMFSLAVAIGIEAIFLFLYHSVITFRKKGRFWLFVFVVLFISDLNWILVYVASVNWNFNYLLSIVVVAGMVSVLNFGMNRWLVFSRGNHKSNSS
ncbi:MAG TPA: GtrA family protein [Candidatus Nanoarchaeia archaeon]|nr:GtrA family protein [Candidatus Nanoarchaeia archaeon]